MKATFGALLAMLVAASAAPYSSSSQSSSIQISGKQIQSLASVLAVHSINGKQDIDQVDQNISCTVAYTLALSSTGPPYTIDLATLDLSNCTYTGP